MNSFRATLGDRSAPANPLVGRKMPTRRTGEGLDAVPVPREVARTADHRDVDRHRLLGEQATILFEERLQPVVLVNLSGGGAMVEGDLTPTIWDKVELNLGEHGSVNCAVRWIRDGRYGLEFAHETHIDADDATLDSLLTDVIRRSFPDVGPAPTPVEQPRSTTPAQTEPVARRSVARHPMIWSGDIHYDHDTTPVRLRNISERGAMVECPHGAPLGAEVHLDLGKAGSVFATVCWVHGDQMGLGFAQPYDLANLAKTPPAIAPARWSSPDYLRDSNESSPWSPHWGRVSVEELKETLEGFMRH